MTRARLVDLDGPAAGPAQLVRGAPLASKPTSVGRYGDSVPAVCASC